MSFLYLDVLLYVFATAFTLVLFGVNYDGRVKHSDTCREANALWVNVEKKLGRKFAVFMIIPLNLGTLTALFFMSLASPKISVFLAVIFGIIAINMIVDVIAVEGKRMKRLLSNHRRK